MQQTTTAQPGQRIHEAINIVKPRLAEVVSIDSKAKSEIMNELALLMQEAAEGRLKGISYAAAMSGGRLIVGCSGTHRNNKDRAISSLFQAATVLVDAV